MEGVVNTLLLIFRFYLPW